MYDFFIVEEEKEQEKYDACFIENNLNYLQNHNKVQSIKNNGRRQTF